jgi:hypothetical protein
MSTRHKAPKSRNDLSFTSRDAEGRLHNWAVRHNQNDNWHDGILIGKRYFAEVAALARYSEKEAFDAIRFAMNASDWSSRGWGEEQGFSEALAAAAIAGLRVLRNGAPPSDYDAPTSADERRRRESVRQAERQPLLRARRDKVFQCFMRAALNKPRRGKRA